MCAHLCPCVCTFIYACKYAGMACQALSPWFCNRVIGFPEWFTGCLERFETLWISISSLVWLEYVVYIRATHKPATPCSLCILQVWSQPMLNSYRKSRRWNLLCHSKRREQGWYISGNYAYCHQCQYNKVPTRIEAQKQCDISSTKMYTITSLLQQ